MSTLQEQKTREQAKKDGFTIIHPAPDRLLLDLDTPESQERYAQLFPVVQGYFEGAIEENRWLSKSGIGMHVVVKLPFHIDMPSRIALQAALGSDPKREILSIGYLHSPSVLFKPDGTKKDK